MRRIDLTRLAGVRPALVSRVPQLAMQLVLLAGLVVIILTGLLGTPVGSRNPAIVLVWIAWWAALMLIAVPFFGRLWCSVCPLPLAGEWLQRGAMLKPRGPARGLGLRWPKRLRGMWLQNAAFVLVALFSLPVLTQPKLTAIVLAGLVMLAVGISLIFQRRTFCRYVCPVGGFIGLYSQAAPLEVRVRDPRVCAAHTTKTCYSGSAEGYGCPWMTFPATLATNVSCGVCLECLRTCSLDNVALNLRPMGSDIERPQRGGLDEAFKSLLLLGSAFVYVLVLRGPWGGLRSAAAATGSREWLVYISGFLVVTIVLLPGLFLLATRPASPSSASRGLDTEGLRRFAPALIPLGLGAWASFSLSFVISNAGIILPSIADPLGLGWNLIGAGSIAWTPPGNSVVLWLQILSLLAGLAWTSRLIRATVREHGRPAWTAIPVSLLSLGLTSALLWVYLR